VSPTSGPLVGVRVLELSTPLAAAYCGMHLADLGADVIRIEPPGGSAHRQDRALAGGAIKLAQWLDRGKRSSVIDLDQAAGRDALHRLVPNIDVVLTNLPPAGAERWGVDEAPLRALNQRLIYMAIGGFDANTPLADRPVTDGVAQAYGGPMAGNGKLEPDGAPGVPGVRAVELLSGILAATGIGAALVNRERSGCGERVDISLLRIAMSLNYSATVRDPISDGYNRDQLVATRAQIREAGGSYTNLVEAAGAFIAGTFKVYWSGYRTKDGGLVFGALTPNNRNAFRKALGITDDPLDQPDYDPTAPALEEFATALKARVRAQLLEKTRAEWMIIFEAVGAPAALVNLPEDLDDDEQAQLSMRELVHPLNGPQWQVAPLVDMSVTPTAIRGPAPALGEATDEMLEALGGLSAEQIATLRSNSAIE
jgi:crotonobetainyl-CoA:carnitine CoA-transferase CaiB-like acyl-CoA transferase